MFWRPYLPKTVQQGTEFLIGLMIAALAVWLFVRWRTGALTNGAARRSGRTAYSIGLVQGRGVALRVWHSRIDGSTQRGLWTRALTRLDNAVRPGSRRSQPRLRTLVRGRRSRS